MSSAINLLRRTVCSRTLYPHPSFLKDQSGEYCSQCFPTVRIWRYQSKFAWHIHHSYLHTSSINYKKRSQQDKSIPEEYKEQFKKLKESKVNQRAKKRAEVMNRLHIRKLQASQNRRPVVDVPQDAITVGYLASLLNVPIEKVKDAVDFRQPGRIVNRNTVLRDFKFVTEIVSTLGYRWKMLPKSKSKVQQDNNVYRSPPAEDKSLLSPRPPIVTIMGHVDHGKTTLLDSLRKTNVAAGEAGGITQAIGAFSVKTNSGNMITFLDTPGHAAFSAMRRRGAKLTDIVVLVVAADDGVMEQTLESIDAAKQAGVPIIVAVNKCDKKNADPKQALDELYAHGIHAEELDGNVQTVKISALKGKGLDKLEESILIQAELLELKANKSGKVEGVVLESRQQNQLGSIASAVVQQGTLERGKWLIAGTSLAKVKSLTDENGNQVKTAVPGDPVDISGWKTLPNAGEEILEVKSEAHGNKVVKWREELSRKEKELTTLEEIESQRKQDRRVYQEIRRTVMHKVERRRHLGAQMVEIYNKEKEIPELNILIKADVDGSLDALLGVLESYDCEDRCLLNIVDCGIGDINEGDIERAAIGQGCIYSFNVKPSSKIVEFAKSEGVIIVSNDVIYHLIQNLRQHISSLLPKQRKLDIQGEAAVQQLFDFTSNKIKYTVAGCKVTSGEMALAKGHILIRGDDIIYEGPILSLRHHKSDVGEVGSGKECGIIFKDESILPEVGDVIQCVRDILFVSNEIPWNPPGF
ncbi:translation initiation factor IF-2, mitochondrial-like [Clavelina lepadiformis]|uniref:translation initiation factor IF-2, mitochondrial-like n=1 Tax=Clavelina lepadiformis TaxID=159417 RepID=UPI00404224C4